MTQKNIFAVITARASASEQRQLLEGIISQAFLKNTDIIVLSNIYNAAEYNDFITLENNIYSLIDSDKPDGFIFTDDAFMNQELRKNVLDMIENTGIPVVCAGSDKLGYPSADSNTMDDLEKITDHLIDVHGFSDIDILTGPENLKTSADRVLGYKKSLEKHGIDFYPEKIIYGDFWTVSGEKTALEYINGKRKIPQALICANDYMAYGLCDAFFNNGIRIPDDITVVGYEYTGDRTSHYPILSTYRRNRTALGRKIFMMLYDIVNNCESGYEVSLDGEMITGDTCSCRADLKKLDEEVSELHKQQYYSMLNATGMLEQYLTESRNVSDLISALNRHSYFIPDLSGLYLCLFEDWCISPDARKKHTGKTDDMICYSIADTYVHGAEPVHFRKSEIIPESLRIDNVPNAYYCCPVFFMDEDYGYMIVRYDKTECFGESFKNWIKIVSNALEFLRMKNDIDYLLQCQNLSDFHDSLTGLSNREGFLNEMKIAVRNADPASRIMVFLLRIDEISETQMLDTEKFDKNNSLLTDISEAFRTFVSGRGRICSRLSENVFSFAAVDYEDEKYAEIIDDRMLVIIYGLLKKYDIYGPDFCSTAFYSGKISDLSYTDIIETLERKTEKSAMETREKMRDPDYNSYQMLRKSIYKSPSSVITAEDACRRFCLSSGHFRTLYKKYFGLSFHQDCIYFRIIYAKYLLVTTKMTLSAIAEKCGYDNSKYFMHQFRLSTGMTPNQYRELNI